MPPQIQSWAGGWDEKGLLNTLTDFPLTGQRGIAYANITGYPIVPRFAGKTLFTIEHQHPDMPNTVRYTLTVEVAPPDGGKVSPAEGSFPAGTIVTLMAIAASQKYRFLSWGGAITGNQNPISIRIKRNTSISANFEKLRFNLATAIVPAGAGRVSPPAGTFDAGSVVNLWATPAPDYRFSAWLGAASGSQNPGAITMNADKSVTAVFEKKSKEP